MSSDNTLKQADKSSLLVVLSRGRTAEGKDFYAYLGILPSNYEKFRKAETEGNFSLEDYGTIIYWDYAKEPPKEIMKMMEKKYGINHNFENDIKKKLEEIIEDN